MSLNIILISNIILQLCKHSVMLSPSLPLLLLSSPLTTWTSNVWKHCNLAPSPPSIDNTFFACFIIKITTLITITSQYDCACLLVLMLQLLILIIMTTIVTRALRPRPGYPHQYQINYYSTNSYRDSFFPLAIKQWNSLPSSIASKDTLPLFQGALSSHSF